MRLVIESNFIKHKNFYIIELISPHEIYVLQWAMVTKAHPLIKVFNSLNNNVSVGYGDDGYSATLILFTSLVFL